MESVRRIGVEQASPNQRGQEVVTKASIGQESVTSLHAFVPKQERPTEPSTLKGKEILTQQSIVSFVTEEVAVDVRAPKGLLPIEALFLVTKRLLTSSKSSKSSSPWVKTYEALYAARAALAHYRIKLSGGRFNGFVFSESCFGSSYHTSRESLFKEAKAKLVALVVQLHGFSKSNGCLELQKAANLFHFYYLQMGKGDDVESSCSLLKSVKQTEPSLFWREIQRELQECVSEAFSILEEWLESNNINSKVMDECAELFACEGSCSDVKEQFFPMKNMKYWIRRLDRYLEKIKTIDVDSMDAERACGLSDEYFSIVLEVRAFMSRFIDFNVSNFESFVKEKKVGRQLYLKLGSDEGELSQLYLSANEGSDESQKIPRAVDYDKIYLSFLRSVDLLFVQAFSNAAPLFEAWLRRLFLTSGMQSQCLIFQEDVECVERLSEGMSSFVLCVGSCVGEEALKENMFYLELASLQREVEGLKGLLYEGLELKDFSVFYVYQRVIFRHLFFQFRVYCNFIKSSRGFNAVENAKEAEMLFERNIWPCFEKLQNRFLVKSFSEDHSCCQLEGVSFVYEDELSFGGSVRLSYLSSMEELIVAPFRLEAGEERSTSEMTWFLGLYYYFNQYFQQLIQDAALFSKVHERVANFLMLVHEVIELEAGLQSKRGAKSAEIRLMGNNQHDLQEIFHKSQKMSILLEDFPLFDGLKEMRRLINFVERAAVFPAEFSKLFDGGVKGSFSLRKIANTSIVILEILASYVIPKILERKSFTCTMGDFSIQGIQIDHFTNLVLDRLKSEIAKLNGFEDAELSGWLMHVQLVSSLIMQIVLAIQSHYEKQSDRCLKDVEKFFNKAFASEMLEEKRLLDLDRILMLAMQSGSASSDEIGCLLALRVKHLIASKEMGLAIDGRYNAAAKREIENISNLLFMPIRRLFKLGCGYLMEGNPLALEGNREAEIEASTEKMKSHLFMMVFLYRANYVLDLCISTGSDQRLFSQVQEWLSIVIEELSSLVDHLDVIYQSAKKRGGVEGDDVDHAAMFFGFDTQIRMGDSYQFVIFDETKQKISEFKRRMQAYGLNSPLAPFIQMRIEFLEAIMSLYDSLLIPQSRFILSSYNKMTGLSARMNPWELLRGAVLKAGGDLRLFEEEEAFEMPLYADFEKTLSERVYALILKVTKKKTTTRSSRRNVQNSVSALGVLYKRLVESGLFFEGKKREWQPDLEVTDVYQKYVAELNALASYILSLSAVAGESLEEVAI